MEKIRNNFYFKIIKAAANEKMLKEGIREELSENIADMGLGNRRLNKNEILMFCAVFKFSVEGERSGNFPALKIKEFYKIQDRSWRKWLNVLITLHSKGLIIYPGCNMSKTERHDPDIFTDNIIYNRIMNGIETSKDLSDPYLVLKEINYLFDMSNGWKTSIYRLEGELTGLTKRVSRDNPLKKISEYNVCSRNQTLWEGYPYNGLK